MHTLHKNPGRFEANQSQLVAQVVDNIVGNGFATDECGEAETTGYYALVLGKRYGFILENDSQGFVTVYPFQKDIALAKFNDIVASMPNEEDL